MHALRSMDEVREQLALRGQPVDAAAEEREAMDALFWALLDDPQTTLLGVGFAGLPANHMKWLCRDSRAWPTIACAL